MTPDIAAMAEVTDEVEIEVGTGTALERQQNRWRWRDMRTGCVVNVRGRCVRPKCRCRAKAGSQS